jgi:S-methylmethionine-dependent homocysteine/selenocysteine methylase
MRIAAYGNVGFADKHGAWVSTDAVEPERFADYAMQWIDAGASIIGGCCGTTPASIAAIKHRLARARSTR